MTDRLHLSLMYEYRDERIMRRIPLLTVALVFGIICRTGLSAEDSFTIVGRNGEIRVIAPDMKLAVEVSNHAQMVKSSLRKRFGTAIEWDNPMVIRLYKSTVKQNETELVRWLVRLWKAGKAIEHPDVYRNRINLKITESLALFYCSDIAAREAGAGNIDDKNIPRWIYVGAAQNIDPENRRVFRRYINAKIESSEVFALEDILQAAEPFPETKIEELYKKQCGSLFEFLTNQKKGRGKLSRALASAIGGDVNSSVLANFGYASVEQMEKAWRQFSVR